VVTVERPIKHGRYGYRLGCRCDICRTTAAAYRKWLYQNTGDNRPSKDQRVNKITPEVGDGWRDKAACKGADLALFFDDEGRRWTEARAMCDVCPVITQCRSWALSYPAKDLYGFWAGMTQRDRRNIQHNTNKKEAPTCPVPISLRTTGRISGISWTNS
jgi:WhiB family redox-sensing transcriptional regulator